MSAVEIAAATLGLVNVALVVRRSVWNYPFGLAMVVLYGRVFFDNRLYSDALLQGFFFVVQIYGWWNWVASRRRTGAVQVERLGGRDRIGWTAGSIVAIGAWGAVMSRYTDASYPWWDATEAILSVVAQILMSRRLIENWVLWITVDVLSIGLYAAKGLWLTMLLYAVFLVLSAWGLIEWRRAEQPDAVAAA